MRLISEEYVDPWLSLVNDALVTKPKGPSRRDDCVTNDRRRLRRGENSGRRKLRSTRLVSAVPQKRGHPTEPAETATKLRWSALSEACGFPRSSTRHTPPMRPDR